MSRSRPHACNDTNKRSAKRQAEHCKLSVQAMVCLNSPNRWFCAEGGYLNESNVLGVLPEALTADVKSILADQAPLVGADTAATHRHPSAYRRDNLFLSWLHQMLDGHLPLLLRRLLRVHDGKADSIRFIASRVACCKAEKCRGAHTTCGRPCRDPSGVNPTLLDDPSLIAL